jgi:hypothetical protein
MSPTYLALYSFAYGAIIARAPDVGIDTAPCCEDVVPIGVVDEGTALRKASSWLESCDLLSVYQEPA